jgi:hypothetical protein
VPASPRTEEYAPVGGWIRAAERAHPYAGISECYYIPEQQVLSDCSPNVESANFLQSDPNVSSSACEGCTAGQCCIALDENTAKLWVMLQTDKFAGNVEYRHLSYKKKQLFNGSRGKEVTNLLKLGAYRILSLEELLRLREQYPECVLPSRFVDRWKGQDSGDPLAKSRLVILGFKDPHVLQLERS